MSLSQALSSSTSLLACHDVSECAIPGPPSAVNRCFTEDQGFMKIADEERGVGQGDLLRIPPDTVHSIWPLTEHTGLRGLAFAIEGADPVDYTS